ncbi:MAG: 30S ribosomal protein S5 [Candidatus Woykebacteria bacterium RIFCSPHIGHO2_12_FULL_45_10]|uniref:Small ribosomal subunit protein uS5 n=1 Tax=Candidatus Woykebacteria bacterium RIFCSPHIGHO2_12_FULL_45_10 TaxID=1802603 RepID=A0A1G1WN44_9BACT|nr:MAG: 30S ribosomal protein S5 [Candidatus Woykebacteria bacterium RIFCSPHIGHO2_12_FULL_45_10]
MDDSVFSEKIVQVNRVSKKTKGGNKIGFSVLVVVGDKNGQVGVGLGKAPEVQAAIGKAVSYAKKHLVSVPLVGGTIPHEIYIKNGAAKLLLKPAYSGTGVIAGGAARAVLEAAGVRDILSKVLGTSNKASNVYATIEALRRLRAVPKKEAKEENLTSKKKVKEVQKNEA